ncbi:MAG: glycosyl transferase [Desulfobulbus propionicus]|nr:MAG: glycosyl transferase [Desulfobulbus propionicus]
MKISIIIPTLNAEKFLAKLLNSLQAQRGIGAYELLVVDSSSTDRSCEIARTYGAHLKSIAREQFDHGGTRTMAARLAQGDLLVFFTQDALPVGTGDLQRLLAVFREDERIGVAYGRQLARVDATPFSEHLRQFNYPETGYVRRWEDRFTHGFKTIFISNSFAAYRREALAAVNYFPEHLLFGEDTRTVANILEAGWSVCYVPEARVYHSHNYTIAEEFRRYFDIGAFHVLEKDLLDKFGTPTGTGKRFVRSEISFLFHRKQYMLVPLSLIRSSAKFIAYALGKRYRLLPQNMAQLLSMHRHWWMKPD